jgi:type II secretory pathway component GspD/PulD (secretin)
MALGQSSNQFYQAARRSAAAGDTLNAFFLYGRAAAQNPANMAAAMQVGQLSKRLLGNAVVAEGADPALDRATRMADRILEEHISPTDAIESPDALPPARLKPSSEKKSFDLRGTPRPVIEEIARGFGIQTIFDPDYQATNAVTFRVSDVTRDEAFRAIEQVTNSFFVPVRGDLMQVFRDTTDKRNTYAPVMAVAIPIPERMTVQEAQELATGVNAIMEMRRIAVDAGRRVIFMRDQEYKIIAARRMITDLMRLRAQVSFEVELLSVAKNSTLDIGFSLPNMASIVNLKGVTSLAQLGHIGTSWFGLSIATANAFASISRSSTEASLRANAVALDGQQVQLRVGDRYPVVSGISGTGATAVPISTYQDLGLILQITPVVQSDGEVTLTVDATYSLLSGGTNNGIPIISTRKFQGTVRLRFDQWAVIQGLGQIQITGTFDGIAGLADIPYLGHIFRHDNVQKSEGQVLVIIKPRLVSEPAWERPTSSFWMGTETKPPTFY